MYLRKVEDKNIKKFKKASFVGSSSAVVGHHKVNGTGPVESKDVKGILFFLPKGKNKVFIKKDYSSVSLENMLSISLSGVMLRKGTSAFTV